MGAEMMSIGGDRLEKPFHPEILQNQESADCMQPMGQTSENVGKDFNITREIQDRYAAESYHRAEVAQKAGWFDDEIVPIVTEVKDPKTGELKKVTLTKDEGPRWGTTYEGLSKIRPAFPDFGDKSTGGNSSQVTDGGMYLFYSQHGTSLTLHSCCGPFDEAFQGYPARSANPCQVRWSHCRRSRSSHHGHWPLDRYSQAPHKI